MSTIRKAPSSSECDSSEESCWTKYFEDFFNNHNIIDDQKKCSLSLSALDSYSISFVSDAAKKNLTDDSTQADESSFKKRKKIKTPLVDHSLEDTASSPVKSPRKKEIKYSRRKR